MPRHRTASTDPAAAALFESAIAGVATRSRCHRCCCRRIRGGCCCPCRSRCGATACCCCCCCCCCCARAAGGAVGADEERGIAPASAASRGLSADARVSRRRRYAQPERHLDCSSLPRPPVVSVLEVTAEAMPPAPSASLGATTPTAMVRCTAARYRCCCCCCCCCSAAAAALTCACVGSSCELRCDEEEHEHMDSRPLSASDDVSKLAVAAS